MDTRQDEAAAFAEAKRITEEQEAKLAAGEEITLPSGSKMARLHGQYSTATPGQNKPAPPRAPNRETRRKMAKWAKSAEGKASMAAARKAREKRLREGGEALATARRAEP